MGREIVHVIDLVDGDPVTVDRYNNNGVGAEFTIDGVTTVVPWPQITRVRRVDRQALRDYAESGEAPDAVKDMAEAVDYDPAEDPAPPPEPGTTVVVPDSDQTEGETGEDDAGGVGTDDTSDDDGGKVDTKAGKTKDFPEADNATMRAWAQSQGLAVSASGPVSKDVATKYAAAHADK